MTAETLQTVIQWVICGLSAALLVGILHALFRRVGPHP